MSKAKEAIGTLVNYASSEKEPLRRLVLLKMKTSEFSVRATITWDSLTKPKKYSSSWLQTYRTLLDHLAHSANMEDNRNGVIFKHFPKIQSQVIVRYDNLYDDDYKFKGYDYCWM